MRPESPATAAATRDERGTNPPARTGGLAVLGAAVVLGLSGDALLRVGPPGVNAALWLGAFLAALALLRRRLPPAPGSGEAAAAAVAVAFALAVAWRDALGVKALDVVVVGTMVALSFLRPLGARPLGVSMSKLLAAVALTGFHAAFGVPVLVSADVRWHEVPRDRRSARILAVARGIAIAAPFVAGFGALLSAADTVFAHVVADVLHIDVAALVSHLLVASFFAWTAGGVLRGALLMRPIPVLWSDRTQAPRLGVIEVGLVLGLLDLLFLGFVAVQVRVVSGGAGYLGEVPSLTYAEYARQGFFQLVAVAALAIPLLLAAHWLLRRESDRDERVFRALAAPMAALLAVMMASAVRRMFLYTAEFGLSELRLYTLGFMAWLALVLAWFSCTVLAGRRDRFAFGAVAAGVAVVAALNVGNPDGVIARVNLVRAAATGRFDARYAGSLSADAVPALVEGLPALDPAQRATVASALARRWRDRTGADWRTWSAGRAAAMRALERGPAEVRERPAGGGVEPRPPCRGRSSARE